MRSWIRTDDGMAVECQCEKWYQSTADAMVLEMPDDSKINAPREAEIEALRREYAVSARRLTRYAVLSGEWRRVPRVALRGSGERSARPTAASSGRLGLARLDAKTQSPCPRG